MNINFSKEVLVLTDKENLMPNIVSLLQKNSLHHHSETRNLSTHIDLLNAAKENGNLNFIKSDILDLIKGPGSPFIIIMNLRNETGLENDRDRLKILKTIILSYILIIESKIKDTISCNLFLLSKENEYNKLKVIMDKPHKILDIVKTTNQKLNETVEKFQNNSVLFGKYFSIFVSNYDSNPLHIESELNTFMSMVKIKERLKSKLRKDNEKIDNGLSKEKKESAEIIFKKNGIIYKNGEATNIDDPDLTEEEIYIYGSFTSYNRLEVLDKLESLIKKGIEEIHEFNHDAPLVINMKEKCQPDASATVTLAQLLIKDLPSFRKAKIKTDFKNNEILKKSQGYSLLSKYIIFSG